MKIKITYESEEEMRELREPIINALTEVRANTPWAPRVCLEYYRFGTRIVLGNIQSNHTVKLKEKRKWDK